MSDTTEPTPDSVAAPLNSVSFDRAELLAAVAFVRKHSVDRSSIPVLSCIRIDARNATAVVAGTDLDVCVAVDVLCKGTGMFAIPAVTLEAALDCIDDGTVVIEDHGDYSYFVAGGYDRHWIPGLPADDFPMPTDYRTTDGSSFAMDFPADVFCGDLKRLQPMISTEGTRYYLNGVHMLTENGALRMEATDGHRMGRIVRDLQFVPESGDELRKSIVHRRAVAAIVDAFAAYRGKHKDQLIRCRFSRNGPWAIFSFDGKTVFAKRIDGTFPDVSRVIPSDPDRFATAFAVDMVSAFGKITRANKAARQDAAAGMRMVDGRLVVSGIGSGMKSATSIPADGDIAESARGGPMGVNTDYVHGIARALKGLVTIATKSAADSYDGVPIRFTSDESPEALFVLMPRRI